MLLDELYRPPQPRPSFVLAFLVVMPSFGIGENVCAAIGRAEKGPDAQLADDVYVIVQITRAPARVKHSSRAVSERAVKRVLSSDRHGGCRRRRRFFFYRSSEDKIVGREIILF